LKLLNRTAISPKMMGAAVILVGLLVGGGAVYIGQAFAAVQGGNSSHNKVVGTFNTDRSYLPPCSPSGAGCPIVSQSGSDSLTIIDYNVVSIISSNGVQTGRSNALTTLAIDDSTGLGYGTGTGTFWGTVGNSSPGAYSLTDTLTFDSTTTPATVSGNWVIVQGSGLNGLAGICGNATFAGTVDLTTGLGTFTFTLTYGYAHGGSAQCNAGEGNSN
jgi:hypothetical protein